MAPLPGHAPMAPGIATADLERRLAALEKAIQVGADGSVTIVSPIRITIKAGATVEIEGSGSVALKGGTIRLNNGGMPVARRGDPIAVNGPSGVLVMGNPTVLA